MSVEVDRYGYYPVTPFEDQTTVIDTFWNSGLYQLDKKTNILTKVLRIYDDNNKDRGYRLVRFEFAQNPGQFREPTEEERQKYWSSFYWYADGELHEEIIHKMT